MNPYPDTPLSAHEKLRAHALIQRLADAVATKTPVSGRERHLLFWLRDWMSEQADNRHARFFLRHHLANPPKILGDTAP